MARTVFGPAFGSPQLATAIANPGVPTLEATATMFRITLGGGGLVVTYTGNFQTAGFVVLSGTVTSVEIVVGGQLYARVDDFSAPYGDVGQAYSLLLAGESNDVLTATAVFNDVLGYGGADVLNGSAIGDILRGGQGADTIDGAAGDDGHLNGNQGNDVVNGGAGNDTAYGGRDNDTVSGGDGNDRLSGDLGNDQLTGGAGADQFVIRTGGGTDTVTDFSLAQGDRIIVAQGSNATNAVVGGNVVITVGDATITLTGVNAFNSDMIAFG